MERKDGKFASFPSLRSERGSILLFALLFGAMLAFVVMAMSSQMGSAMGTQKTRLLYNEYIEFVESMRAQLDDPFVCAALLGGQSINTSHLNAASGASIGRVATTYGRLNGAQITPGWEARPGGVRIQAITAHRTLYDSNPTGTPVMTPTPSQTARLADGATYQADQVELLFVPSVPSINLSGPGRSYLRIKLTLLSQGGVIQGCHGPTSAAGLCMAMGGTFDWRSNGPVTVPAPGGKTRNVTYPKFRCHPDRQTFYAPGGLIQAADEAQADNVCGHPYTASSVGSFVGDGETPSSTPQWICSWANIYSSP